MEHFNNTIKINSILLSRDAKMTKKDQMKCLRWDGEQMNARANQIEDFTSLGQSQVAAAQIGHAAAVLRGNVAANMMKESLRSENTLMEAHHAKRIDDIMALKESTAASRKEVKDSAGEYRTERLTAAQNSCSTEL